MICVKKTDGEELRNQKVLPQGDLSTAAGDGPGVLIFTAETLNEWL
jgi:hypothetical protein